MKHRNDSSGRSMVKTLYNMGPFNIVCTVEHVFFCLLFCSFFNSTIKLYVFLLCTRVSVIKADTHLLLGKREVAGRAQAEGGTSPAAPEGGTSLAAAVAAAAAPHSS